MTDGFPGDSGVKDPPPKAGDAGSIPASGRFPGGGNGNPLQYSGLGNPMTEEPGGSQRVRQDLANKQQQQKVTDTQSEVYNLGIRG